MRKLCLFIVCAVLFSACTEMSSSPSAVYSLPLLSNVLDRERMGDQKVRERDPSSTAEYQTARGLALARIENIEIAMRNAIFVSHNPPPSRAVRDVSGYMSWRQAMLEFMVTLSGGERNYLTGRVEQMSRDERERVYLQNGNLDSFTQEMNVRALRNSLDEWRGLREADSRIRRKCRECS